MEHSLRCAENTIALTKKNLQEALSGASAVEGLLLLQLIKQAAELETDLKVFINAYND